jgi:hypothetical protein
MALGDFRRRRLAALCGHHARGLSSQPARWACVWRGRRSAIFCGWRFSKLPFGTGTYFALVAIEHALAFMAGSRARDAGRSPDCAARRGAAPSSAYTAQSTNHGVGARCSRSSRNPAGAEIERRAEDSNEPRAGSDKPLCSPSRERIGSDKRLRVTRREGVISSPLRRSSL